MLRHLVNFSLLLTFLALAVSGVAKFVLPFEIQSTRLHIVFGILLVLLVGLHLAGRWSYFVGLTRARTGRTKRPPPWALVLSLLLCLGLGWSAWSGVPPASWLISQNYEARHRAIIFRADPLVTRLQLGNEALQLRRDPETSPGWQLQVDVDFGPNWNGADQALALWAETSQGSMIETLLLSPKLAYAEEFSWGGRANLRREDLLPLWRHAWTLLSGIAPGGEVDAWTTATPEHSFSLNSGLEGDLDDGFVISLELNRAADPEGQWNDPVLGQPSVLFQGYLDPELAGQWILLQPVGHGGGAEQDGAVRYDLDAIPSAFQLIDKVLVKLEPVN